jgi:polyisoprenoid-binding protein YceI
VTLKSARDDGKETITMDTRSAQLNAPAAKDLLMDGVLAGEWALEPRASSVGLKSKSIGGLVPVNGVFGEVSGGGAVSAKGEVSGILTVGAASIDTKQAKRDTHLRSADFFDTANYPDITFTVDGIQPSGHGVTVTGSLTVRDRTRPLSFDALASVQGDGEIWVDAEVRINRADFGLTWNRLGLVSMINDLTIHAVFTRR